MRSLFGWSCVCAMLALGCDMPGDTAADGGTTCGSATCTASQVCAYRECTDKERCVVATQCPTDSTPTTCNGQPGCLLAQCAPVVTGCRDVPTACNNDVQCACTSVCGDAGGCAKVDGRNIDCTTP